MPDRDVEVIELHSETTREDLQVIVGSHKPLTPEEAYEYLAKRCRHAKAPYWKNLQPVLLDDTSKPPSCQIEKLQCQQCDAKLSVSNPGNLKTEHFDETGNCKSRKRPVTVSSSGATSLASASKRPCPSLAGNDVTFLCQ
jgi:hypothetical protein